MSFWIWVGIVVVVVLVFTAVMDRRRRGGWFVGYSESSRDARILGGKRMGGDDKGGLPGDGP